MTQWGNKLITSDSGWGFEDSVVPLVDTMSDKDWETGRSIYSIAPRTGGTVPKPVLWCVQPRPPSSVFSHTTRCTTVRRGGPVRPLVSPTVDQGGTSLDRPRRTDVGCEWRTRELTEQSRDVGSTKDTKKSRGGGSGTQE